MAKKLTLTLVVDADELKKVLLAAAEESVAAEADAAGDDEDVEEVPAPKKKPAAKKVVDEEEDIDDTEEVEETEEGEEAEEESAPKKGKKLSLPDVQAACKAKVHSLVERGISAADARARVVKMLTKEFGVKSVASLKATQYAEAIELMS
jgi:hypothetical protein